MRRVAWRWLALLIVTTATAAAARPKLAVLVVVDQLGTETMRRRLPGTKGGFARLTKEGFHVLESVTPYAPPVTGPAHATLVTGATPDVHGIVGNGWYERGENRAVVAGEDVRYSLVGRAPRAGVATAPTQLRVGTIGDALKLAHSEAQVVAIAGKGRSATLLGGASADLALWLDPEAPRFTTSTYYASGVPGWLEPLNTQLGAAALKGFDAPFRIQLPRGGITGEPGQTLQGLALEAARSLAASAASDEAVLEAGLLAVNSLAMGKDATPDLLLLGLSRHDAVLHAFGPVSPEAARAFVSIDAALERFIQGLDQAIGRKNYVLIVTGDHGGPPHPDDARARRIPTGHLDTEALEKTLERVADAALGPGDYFAGFHNTGFSVRELARARIHGIDAELRHAARAVEGVHDLVPEAEIRSRAAGTLGELYARSFDAQRSPDFVLIPKSYFMFGARDATSHASPYLYDRSVPLMLFGVGVKRGRLSRASPLDVAPTLSRLLEIELPPAADLGRALEEALVGGRGE